jgi:hypothetical protein
MIRLGYQMIYVRTGDTEGSLSVQNWLLMIALTEGTMYTTNIELPETEFTKFHIYS